MLGRRHEAEIGCACVIPTLMPPTAGGCLSRSLPTSSACPAGGLRRARPLQRAVPGRGPSHAARGPRGRRGPPASSNCAESLPADLVVMGTHGSPDSSAPCSGLGHGEGAATGFPSRPDRTAPGPRGRPHAARGLQEHPVSGGLRRRFRRGRSASPSPCARESEARLLLVHVLEGSADGGARDLSHWTVPEYRLVLEKEAQGAPARSAPAPEPGGLSSSRRCWLRGSPTSRSCGWPRAGPATSSSWAPTAAGLGAALFGSTAQHVVRAAACPVVTVRSQSRFPEHTSGF